MTYNPRKIAQREQEAMEQGKNELDAKMAVEDALSKSTPQQRYEQMLGQQDMNGQ